MHRKDLIKYFILKKTRLHTRPPSGKFVDDPRTQRNIRTSGTCPLTWRLRSCSKAQQCTLCPLYSTIHVSFAKWSKSLSWLWSRMQFTHGEVFCPLCLSSTSKYENFYWTLCLNPILWNATVTDTSSRVLTSIRAPFRANHPPLKPRAECAARTGGPIPPKF